MDKQDIKSIKNRFKKVSIWYYGVFCYFIIVLIIIAYVINPVGSIITTVIVIVILIVGIIVFIYYILPNLIKKYAIKKGTQIIKKKVRESAKK